MGLETAIKTEDNLPKKTQYDSTNILKNINESVRFAKFSFINYN